MRTLLLILLGLLSFSCSKDDITYDYDYLDTEMKWQFECPDTIKLNEEFKLKVFLKEKRIDIYASFTPDQENPSSKIYGAYIFNNKKQELPITLQKIPESGVYYLNFYYYTIIKNKYTGSKGAEIVKSDVSKKIYVKH